MKAREYCYVLTLLIVVLAAYSSSFSLPFQFDDNIFLRDDNLVLGRWRAFLLPPAPRLLSWLTLLVQYQIHGSTPLPFHIFNTLLHTLNAVLAFLLLRTLLQETDSPTVGSSSLLQPDLSALLGALVFALHPVQTEAVFYIYQRSTLLAFFFGALSTLFYLQGRQILAITAFLFAAASKEVALILPLVFWFLVGIRDRKWKPDKIVLGGAAVSGAVGFAYFLYWQWTGEVTVGGNVRESFIYLAGQLKVFWHYMAVVAQISPLNLDRVVSGFIGFVDPTWWLSGISLVTAAALVLLLARKWRWVALWPGLFGAFLLPTSSLIPSQDLIFDHRLYFSMIAVGGFASSLTLYLQRTASRKTYVLLLPILAGLVLFVHWSGDIVKRSKVWRSPIALWRDTAEKSPGKFRPNYNLGVELIRSDPQEAVSYLTRAISISPGEARAYQALGQAYLEMGSLEPASRSWQKALELDPADPETYLALGQLSSSQNDYFSASNYFQQAVERSPGDWRAYYHEAQLNLRFGFLQKAIELSQQGLRSQLDETRLRSLLIQCMLRTGNLDRAVQLAHENLTFRKNSALYYQLASVLFAAGRNEEAVSWIEEGLRRAKSPAETERGRELKLEMSRSR